MTEQSVYILIVALAVIGACYTVHRLGRPIPKPTHLDDLKAELRQAQHNELLELKSAERSAALAEVYTSQVRRYKQEIVDEEHRVRAGANCNGGEQFSTTSAGALIDRV